MLFNSLDFAIFIPIVFAIYWGINRFRLTYQNLFLVGASYVFYGWWDFRFLGLIALSSFVDFFLSQYMSKSESRRQRKTLLVVSLSFNLGLLMFFKYFNFFIDSFNDAFQFFGSSISISSLSIILPVGISFYTFQTLSYTIDVYRGNLKPEKNITAFLAYVSFFPQLVAGPIERATNFLPQFSKKRSFDYSSAVDGLRQILWGLFKKVVIADTCAIYVNNIFESPDVFSGSTLALGAVLFAFQIYGDFSGYSDIAIGLARLFGFKLMRNFAFPYFSRDIAEFWRRWHISLSTWFRDYLYIPLGGSKGSINKQIRNVFIIFVVSGFWHGAKWTFIIWGGLNALYFLPLLLMKRNRSNLEIVAAFSVLPGLKDLFKILLTFSLTCFAWIFFRAESMAEANNYIYNLFSLSFFSIPEVRPFDLLLLLIFFLSIEWVGRRREYGIEGFLLETPKIIRYCFYYVLIILIGIYSTNSAEFIYFQF